MRTRFLVMTVGGLAALTLAACSDANKAETAVAAEDSAIPAAAAAPAPATETGTPAAGEASTMPSANTPRDPDGMIGSTPPVLPSDQPITSPATSPPPR